MFDVIRNKFPKFEANNCINSYGLFQSSFAMKGCFKKYLKLRQFADKFLPREEVNISLERVQFGDKSMSHFSGLKISSIPYCKILTAWKTCCCFSVLLTNLPVNRPIHDFYHKKQTRHYKVARCQKFFMYLTFIVNRIHANITCHMMRMRDFALSSLLHSQFNQLNTFSRMHFCPFPIRLPPPVDTVLSFTK